MISAQGRGADCNPPFTDEEAAGYAHRAARCADPLGYNPPYALTPHLVGYPAKILRNDIPIAPRLEIVFLQGTIFGRSRDERGL